MKNYKFIKLNRIALISIAAAALMACSSVTAFAAVSPLPANTAAKVVYTGDGTTTKTVEVKNADNLGAFKNLMPGGTTNPQEITIENQSSQNMRVYFQAQPTETTSKKVLDALQMKITFKMDNSSATQTLYEGPASGKTGTTTVSDIVSTPISLGYVYGKSQSGVLSATLTAPETMNNQYQLAAADIKWIFQFELTDPVNSLPHNNGGGNSTPIDTVSAESIGTDSSPQAGPTVSTSSPEEIPNDDVPLSKPPKTGEDATFLWVVIAAAAVACVVFVASRKKIRHQA